MTGFCQAKMQAVLRFAIIVLHLPFMLLQGAVSVTESPVSITNKANESTVTYSNGNRTSEESNKVKIEVYYETDCPDSMYFIVNELYPTYQEMSDIMDIELAPYGKSKEIALSDGTYIYQCHHGRSECYGNVVQSCAIEKLNVKQYLSFIYCMESYPIPSQNAEKCARRQNLNWDTIEKCVVGEEGMKLQHQNAMKTENLTPPLYFVPWIIFNNQYSKTNHVWALRDLYTAVCLTYKGPEHPKCSKKHYRW